jgi:quercetin dioxygenase-like cupin family protein
MKERECFLMSYKNYEEKNEAYTYEAPGHFDVRTTRLHDPKDVNQGGITMGLSHFLPGGGCNYGSNAKETIYYIVEGQMYLESEVGTPDEVKTTLYAGDSYHCGPNTKKSVLNTGSTACQMLVVLITPPQE